MSELMLRWQELRDQGRSVSAEELCADCPEQLEELKRQIEALRSMQQFLDTSAGSAPNEAMPGSLASGCESAAQSTVQPDNGASGEHMTRLDLRGYELIERLGGGGMGDVYRAADPALGRDLAVKVMKTELRGFASAERRFLREARVTGSLQHPGIVPIHNLGRLKDGRLHYTMRLVRGDTFADILKDKAGKPEHTPVLLSIFEKVCQVVAYAHSKHVIHRDLKPSNVMVGRFGEVQVMDWGLAKLLKAEDESTTAEAPADPVGTRIHTEAGDTPLERTRMGREMGTPAYMPPEQALGEWDTVDERADVFALGVLLCEVLTGQPPYTGQTWEEVLRKAKRGDRAEALARLDRCGADGALTALCRECLASEREGRPRDAEALAQRVAAYQAEVQERLRRAELERAEAQVKVQEERKRRRLAVMLAAMVLVLVVGVIAALSWQQRQDAWQRQGVEGALAEVERLQKQARWKEARAVLEQAESRLGEAGAQDLRQRLEQARHDLEFVVRLDDIRLKRATTVEGRFDTATAEREYGEAFRDAGLGEVGDDTAIVAARISSLAVSGALVAALDDWAVCATGSRRDWVLDVARKADPDPARDRMRDPKMWNDGAALARLAETQVAELSPQMLAVVGLRLILLKRDAEPLLQMAQERYPSDFWIYFALGNALPKEKAGEAVGYYRAALALRPGTTAVHYNLGYVLHEMGRLDEAIAQYHKALERDPKDAKIRIALGYSLRNKGRLDEAIAELREALAIEPKDAMAHTNLGNALDEKGRPDEAIAEYREALAINPKSALAHSNLAIALRATGRLDEAIAECRKAIELDPKDAKAHSGLGVCLRAKGRLDEAIAEYHKAIAIDPKLAAAHSNLGSALRDKGRFDEAIVECHTALALDPKLAAAHSNLGSALLDKGRLDEAIAHYHTALELDPKDAKAHSGLGVCLRAKGRLDEAIAEYHKAIAIDPKDAIAHCNLGNALLDKGRLDEAIAEYHKALAIDPKYAVAHSNLGKALGAKGRMDAAITEYHKALELDPKIAMAHYNLGNALRAKDRLDEAIAHYCTAIELDPKDAKFHSNLGSALRHKGHLDEAIAEYRKALELGPKDAKIHHANLADTLRATGRLDEAIAECRKAIELDPKLAQPYGVLGLALLTQGQFTAARQPLQRCLDLLPGNHPLRQTLLLRLRQCEQMIVLEKRLAAIEEGEAKPVDAAELIGLVQLCQLKKRHVAAARLCADAFVADPELAADLNQQHRYNAACSAALAAAGQGEDAANLDDKERVRLRRQALDWLRADLALWGNQVENAKPNALAAVRQTLQHWQKDTDLASLRDAAALNRLPDGERTAWQSLWHDADELLKRVAKKEEANTEQKKPEP
jgi:tetratricopeptide (TPR) repeat protein